MLFSISRNLILFINICASVRDIKYTNYKVDNSLLVQ